MKLSRGSIVTYAELKALGLHTRLRIRPSSFKHRGPGVYALDFGEYLKIGQTKDLGTRLDYYLKGWCQPIKGMLVYSVADPIVIHTEIMRVFKSKSAIGLSARENIIKADLGSIQSWVEAQPAFKPILHVKPRRLP